MSSLRRVEARAPRTALAAVALLAASACLTIVTHVKSRDLPRAPQRVTSPVRAHLVDGSIALFRSGVTVTATQVIGAGVLVSPTMAESTTVEGVSLGSVLGLETFETQTDAASSIGLTVLATVATVGAAVALTCIGNPKCFGSCPTAYSDSAGTLVLEAEGFSYSIARLFEDRDVDRLRATADRNGRVQLEIRNEALETHYINQVALLDVHHARDEVIAPDVAGNPVALRALSTPVRAFDRAGRDVRALLAAHDGAIFSTHPDRVMAATDSDATDWIELEVPAPPADSAALYLRLRNSLLNTVLLYDVMLGDRGAGALDYVARDLNRIGPAVNLGRWYAEHMGLRFAVHDGTTWQPVGRLADTGPVAWKDIVVVVPVPRGQPTLRIRMTFVAANWRIEQAAVARTWRRPATRQLPLARVVDAAGHADAAALTNMRDADTSYLQTQAGQRFLAQFEAGAAPMGADSTRTFLIAWQGYYTEWIRQGWLAQAPSATPATDSTGVPILGELMRRWRSSGTDLERQFFSTRVPVR